MWVNTMVLTRPMRAASQAAPRCETALAARAKKKSVAIAPALAPNRSKKKYDSRAVPRNPPASESIRNRPEIRRTMRRLSGVTVAKAGAGAPPFASTAGLKERFKMAVSSMSSAYTPNATA